jgi:hypothetical protein
MNNMSNLFDEVEAELLKQFKAITPEQLAEEERRRQVKRDYEALHTPIETDEDRANKDEYPDDEDGEDE